MGKDRNAPAPPAIPFGAIVPDPCLIEIPIREPFLVFIDLAICRILDENYTKNGLCDAFWDANYEFPPLPVRLIIDMFNFERVEFHYGQLAQFYRVQKQSPIAQFVRTPEMHLPPGYFQAYPVDQTLDDYWFDPEEAAEKEMEIESVEQSEELVIA